jgi:hypothetical protein
MNQNACTPKDPCVCRHSHQSTGLPSSVGRGHQAGRRPVAWCKAASTRGGFRDRVLSRARIERRKVAVAISSRAIVTKADPQANRATCPIVGWPGWPGQISKSGFAMETHRAGGNAVAARSSVPYSQAPDAAYAANAADRVPRDQSENTAARATQTAIEPRIVVATMAMYTGSRPHHRTRNATNGNMHTKRKRPGIMQAANDCQMISRALKRVTSRSGSMNLPRRRLNVLRAGIGATRNAARIPTAAMMPE